MLNKINSLLAVLVFTVLFSCSKTEINNYEIENVTITLDAQELISKVSKPFVKRASVGKMANTNTDFIHAIPNQYKAYFISNETKGQYTKDQIIKVVDVIEGANEITVPKLKYRVVVTSYYDFSDNELRYQNTKEALPKSSDKIYLYGENIIDYSVTTTGTVEVKNPYAAIMIANNQWVTGTPKYYTDGNKEFTSVPNWYLLYVLAPVQGGIGVPVNTQQNIYNINNRFESNTVYEYTFNGVGDTDGSLIVNTEEIFKVVHKETIDLY